MEKDIISAEIETAPDNTNQAALALQRIGFRIMHIGPTISVQGPRSLWESTFNVSFETQKKINRANTEGGDVVYYKALEKDIRIPNNLRTLISGLAFVEPPEFY